jgi:1-acyl-sn-glycerol-3-phosphate acyltransferase
MEPWRYDTAQDLNQPLIDRLRRFPREPAMLVYGVRLLAALLLRGWLRVYHRLRIVGREHLPTDRSFVLVANHVSHLDALCLLAVLPLRKLHRAFPAAAEDYFFVSVPRLILSAVVINALPFDRHIDPQHSLNLCQQLLEHPGNILVIFPEGTRSVTGEIDRFKLGVGLVLAGTSYPVVPCYLHGTYAAWPKGAWFPKPRRVQVTIGQPRAYAHLSPGKASAIQICQELRDAVLALASDTAPPVVTPEEREAL